MKIAFFGDLDQEKKEYYEQTLGQNHHLEFFDHCFGEKKTEHFDYDAISIFVACQATKENLEQFPNVKLIAVRSTGFDNVDIPYCKEKGIVVATVPAYGSHTVAEYTFALLLQISRKVAEATWNTKNNNFSLDNLRGFDLNEKTIGIVGTGKIGANAARIAKGFNMHILAYDVFKNEELAEGLGFEYVELDHLLESSDIVSLHAPLTPQTHHLINSGNIFRMKKGSVFLNTARGGLLETKALLDAMKQGIVVSAGLDVLEEEKQLHGIEPDTETTQFARELIALPNVRYSAHAAFYTKEAEHNIMETTRENIEKFVQNTPQNNVAV